MIRKLAGIIVGLLIAAFFWSLAWYVSDEEGALGVIATGLFAIVGLGSGVLGYIWIALPDQPERFPQQLKSKSRHEPKTKPTGPIPGRFGRVVGRIIAAGLMAFGLLVGIGVIGDALENDHGENIVAGIAVLVCCVATGGMIWWDMNRRARRRQAQAEDGLATLQGVLMANVMNMDDFDDFDGGLGVD